MNVQNNLMDPSCSADIREKATKRRGNLIVLSGPSGVGKDTVVARVLEQVAEMSRSVSVTTRKRREGEIDGVDYFFVTVDRFNDYRDQNELIEWAEFAGCCYGTPRRFVLNELERGKDVLFVIEVNGARQILHQFPDAVLIFLSPPSFEELEARLRSRGTEPPEKIEARLRTARWETSQKHLFQYDVVNNVVSEAVNNLEHIIYAERLKIRNTGQ